MWGGPHGARFPAEGRGKLTQVLKTLTRFLQQPQWLHRTTQLSKLRPSAGHSLENRPNPFSFRTVLPFPPPPRFSQPPVRFALAPLSLLRPVAWDRAWEDVPAVMAKKNKKGSGAAGRPAKQEGDQVRRDGAAGLPPSRGGGERPPRALGGDHDPPRGARNFLGSDN